MRLRFTIRDLFWLTLVVALATGWWLEHAAVRDERRALEQKTKDVDRQLHDIMLFQADLAKKKAEQAVKQIHGVPE
jgi:hypothetical protein